MYEILNKINSPNDLKKLNINDLNRLATEIREALFNRLTKIGGHFGSNFGFVEPTIALHYVFNSPIDKFVFDVSHQSYTHKILTGRKNGYITDEHFKDDSGYSNPEESEHDLFNIGHTSTSISLATGLAKGRDILGEKENVIAVIGDGSLSGGEALEGLNVAGSELNSNLIIVVNDNEQSISETHGGIYKNLKELRETKGKSPNNLFKAMGLDYIYEENGNDIEVLINLFKKIKDINHPIVVHIHTKKGKGYKLAEDNREAWHWCLPFNRETGKPTISFPSESYASIAKQAILEKAKKDKKVIVVTPNMPGSLGLNIEERKSLGEQFLDVGIAEEEAVAVASGIAKRGGKPVVITNTTFMQRTYDQMSQDVCINNSPAVFVLNYSHFNGLTDVTHLGIFGISLFSNIPNLVVFCPSSKEELEEIIDYSLTQKDHPIVILLPGGEVVSRKPLIPVNKINKYEIITKGDKVAILTLGDFFKKGESLADEANKVLGINATLINARFASVDKQTLDSLLANHKIFITLEDGVLEGGWGQKIASYLSDKNVYVKNYGLEKKFYDRYNPQALLEELGITNPSIIKDIKNLLE